MPEEDKKVVAEKPTETITPVSEIDYNYVGSNKAEKKIVQKGKAIFAPNKRMITGLILVILIVLIMTLVKFPFSSFLSGNLNAKASVGYPLTFLNFEISGNNLSIQTANLLIDIILYLLTAYIINIILNLLSRTSNFKTKEVADEKPSIFKDQTITKTDKLAEKISQ